jgi:hypothetical protein
MTAQAVESWLGCFIFITNKTNKTKKNNKNFTLINEMKQLTTTGY